MRRRTSIRCPTEAIRVTNLVSSPLADRQSGQFTIKTDHIIWHGSPLMFRYSFSRDNRDNPFPVRARNLPGFGTTVLDQGHNFATGLTKAMSSRTFNELRVGVNALYRDDYAAEPGHGSVRRTRHHGAAAEQHRSGISRR